MAVLALKLKLELNVELSWQVMSCKKLSTLSFILIAAVCSGLAKRGTTAEYPAAYT